ncbi:MAG: alpha/beta hydrolase [Flavobacterium sp.]|nr:alpha/beta hydrolase [Flavobacterium sp.]
MPLFKKSMISIAIILVVWVIFAQSCMKMRISDSKAQAEFKAANVPLQLQTVTNKGFQLHYAQTGNDTLPTLFFVHGSPGSWDAFKTYLQDTDLLKQFRMVSIDRPGFGYSEFGSAKNLQQQSNIISPLLQQLNNGHAIYVVGHSLGGPLAVKLVADNPNTFAGMVLLSAAVDPALEPKEKWRGFLLHSSLQIMLPGAFKPSNEELWYLKTDLVPLANQFASITCAVWIVHGDKDSFVPVGNVAYATKKLVNAKFVKTTILHNAPHFIPWAPWYKNVKKILLSIGVN